ncbi:MAG: type domain protein [Myxococcales bacterium]|nr:type domain protein [Myxococcales bacterium]
MLLEIVMHERLVCVFVATAIGCGGGSDTLDAAPDGPPREATFRVFNEIPQFGIYTSTEPNYAPPDGVLMWSYGTVFVTKLSTDQKAQIGDQLAARLTFIAQCDNYDRLGGLFFLVEPPGQMPQPTDPRVEVVRFITPFSDFHRGPLAMHTYPDADISAFAHTLADPTKDIWFGIAGGSNPYNGDPCTVGTPQPPDFAAVGFKYSVDLTSKGELSPGNSLTLSAVGGISETMTPITGTFTNSGGTAATGHVTVIVSGHGPGAGGDEYEYTQDTVKVNGQSVGTFSTMIDCAPFAQFSPDGNPGIFGNNTTNNPRNWCPGALVPSHTFAATLPPGDSTVTLEIAPGTVPNGSYYWTSISFGAP